MRPAPPCGSLAPLHTFHLDSAWTLAAAVATILLGMRLHRA